MKGLRISIKYIYDRHRAPAEDELAGDWTKAEMMPANYLCNLADRAEKFVFISDDMPKYVLSELVTGAWLYEGKKEDWMEHWMISTAKRITSRWDREGHLL
jgi:hypothetical protein